MLSKQASHDFISGRLQVLLAALFAFFLCAGAAHCQAPDCKFNFSLSVKGQIAPSAGGFNNLGASCQDWYVTYKSSGFSAVSLRFESSADSGGVAGSWGAFGGSVSAGSNPATAVDQGSTHVYGFYPWLRVKLIDATGTGRIDGQAFGYRVKLAGVALPGYIYPITPVVPGDWTNVHFGAGTVRTNQSGAISIKEPGTSDNLRGLCTVYPSPPMRARLTFTVPMQYATNDAGLTTGVVAYNSVQDKGYLFQQNNSFTWNGLAWNWATFTNDGLIYGPVNTFSISPNWPITIEVYDDGTNIRFRFWDGYQETWIVNGGGSNPTEPAYARAGGYINAPDKLCFTVYRGNGNMVSWATLMGYDVIPGV